MANLNLNRRKIIDPTSHLIEKVAAELAAVWYEIGRAQGLTSKWSNPKDYAIANLEKFVPKAIEHLTSMLNRSDIAKEMKDAIYDALVERVNDPTNITSTEINGLPDIDVKKLIELSENPVDKALSQALTPKKTDTVLDNQVRPKVKYG